MCAPGEDPWDVSDGEVINHRDEVEKVELPRRERGSRPGVGGRLGVGGGSGNAPQRKTTEAIITLVKISATSGQRGRDRQTMHPSLWLERRRIHAEPLVGGCYCGTIP